MVGWSLSAMHRRGAKLVRILTGSSSSALSITGRTITRPRAIAPCWSNEIGGLYCFACLASHAPSPPSPVVCSVQPSRRGAGWSPSGTAVCGPSNAAVLGWSARRFTPGGTAYPNGVCSLALTCVRTTSLRYPLSRAQGKISARLIIEIVGGAAGWSGCRFCRQLIAHPATSEHRHTEYLIWTSKFSAVSLDIHDLRLPYMPPLSTRLTEATKAPVGSVALHGLPRLIACIIGYFDSLWDSPGNCQCRIF